MALRESDRLLAGAGATRRCERIDHLQRRGVRDLERLAVTRQWMPRIGIGKRVGASAARCGGRARRTHRLKRPSGTQWIRWTYSCRSCNPPSCVDEQLRRVCRGE